MITKEDFTYLTNNIKGKYHNWENKLEIVEYLNGQFSVFYLGLIEECNISLHSLDKYIPDYINSLEEAINWCNYYIDKHGE
jgi:hypothetical protein